MARPLVALANFLSYNEVSLSARPATCISAWLVEKCLYPHATHARVTEYSYVPPTAIIYIVTCVGLLNLFIVWYYCMCILKINFEKDKI